MLKKKKKKGGTKLGKYMVLLKVCWLINEKNQCFPINSYKSDQK